MKLFFWLITYTILGEKEEIRSYLERVKIRLMVY